MRRLTRYFRIKYLLITILLLLGSLSNIEGELLPSLFDVKTVSSQTESVINIGGVEGRIPPPIDRVSLYGIKGTLDTNSHTLVGSEIINYTNQENIPLKELYFHLYPNAFREAEVPGLPEYRRDEFYPDGFYPGGIDIDYVGFALPSPLNIEGIEGEILPPSSEPQYEELSYSIESVEGGEGTILKVALENELNPQDKLIIKIDFRVTIPRMKNRFGYYREVTSVANWYPILAVYDEDGWHKEPYYHLGDPFYSDIALYKVDITLPEDEVVAATGNLINTVQNDNGTRTLHWESELVRDFAFIASPLYKIKTAQLGDITVYSYFFPSSEVGGDKVLDIACRALEIFNQIFGKYPYKQLSLVESYQPGGMEYPNLIFLDTTRYKSTGEGEFVFEFIAAHEIAHQWWYNMVGNNEYLEPWLDEGLTNYSAALYFEGSYGEPLFRKELISTYLEGRYVRYLKGNGKKIDIVNRPLTYFTIPGSYSALVYAKGALIHHMLRGLSEDEVFFDILRSYFNKYKFENAKVKDFIEVCETVSGDDWNWFFDQWLETSADADFQVKDVSCCREDDGEYNSKIVLMREGKAEMPVKVEIKLRDGSPVERVWNKEDKEKDIELKTSSALDSVIIDPDYWVLDIDRSNNFGSIDNMWSAEKKIAHTSYRDDLGLAVGGEGVVHLVWSADDSQGIGLHWTRLNSKGDILTPPVNLTPKSKRALHPRVALDSKGDLHLVWVDERGNPEIYYKKLDNEGRVLINEVNLTDNPASSRQPSLAIDANDELHLAWSDFIDDNFEIYYQRLSSDGDILISKRITTTPAVSQAPAIITSSEGGIYIAWLEAERWDRQEIHWAHLDKEGNIVVTRKLADMTSTGSEPPKLLLQSDPLLNIEGVEGGILPSFDNNIHLVCETTVGRLQKRGEIYYMKLNTSGDISIPLQKVLEQSSSASYSSLAVNKSREAKIAWVEEDSRGLGIQYVGLDEAGYPTFYPQRLNEGKAGTSNPVIVLDKEANEHLVWLENEPGGFALKYKNTVIGGKPGSKEIFYALVKKLNLGKILFDGLSGIFLAVFYLLSWNSPGIILVGVMALILSITGLWRILSRLPFLLFALLGGIYIAAKFIVIPLINPRIFPSFLSPIPPLLATIGLILVIKLRKIKLHRTNSFWLSLSLWIYLDTFISVYMMLSASLD